MTASTTDLAAYPTRHFAAWDQHDPAIALDVIAEAV
jgi:hypothetical protein